MFVELADFAAPPYELPDLGLTDNSFADFVERMEKELLIELLGARLYSDFINGLTTPTPPIADHWLALKDGGPYLGPYGEGYTYLGINDFMVPYIYAMWTRANFDANAITGVAVNNSENAEFIAPSTRICRGYNEMVAKVGQPCNVVNTLYGFLQANPEAYPYWIFDEPDFMNIWNI